MFVSAGPSEGGNKPSSLPGNGTMHLGFSVGSFCKEDWALGDLRAGYPLLVGLPVVL